MAIDKEMVGATTRMLVLSALAREPDYGYALIKRINELAGGVFTWHEGTLYPVLHKLEREGCLRVQWQETDNGRRRKYYYITAKGREAQQESAQTWLQFGAVVRRVAEAANG